MADAKRVKRLADQIQQEVAMILQTKVRDPRLGLVTITNVKVSRDLGYADIAVTFIVAGPAKEERSDQERAEILQKASAYIRMELAAHLKLRAIPHLRFHFDDVSVQGPKLEALIEQARLKDEQNQQRFADVELDDPDAASSESGSSENETSGENNTKPE